MPVKVEQDGRSVAMRLMLTPDLTAVVFAEKLLTLSQMKMKYFLPRACAGGAGRPLCSHALHAHT